MVSSASAKNQSALSAGSPSNVFFGRLALPNNPPAFFFGVVALDFFLGEAAVDLDFEAVFFSAEPLLATLRPSNSDSSSFRISFSSFFLRASSSTDFESFLIFSITVR